MVTVTDILIRERKDGSSFICLELSGGVELVQSTNSGRYYATVRKCSIPCTFDESLAKTMVGQRIEGDIVKVICEPYEFTNPRTGEIMHLQHSWAYRPKDSQDLVGHTRVRELA